jgi:hypothetical protein
MAQMRIQEFLISALKYQNIPKIQIFLKFMGLLGNPDFEIMKEKLYLEILLAMKTDKVRGFDLKIDLIDFKHHVPYIRCKVWLEKFSKHFFDKKSLEYVLKELRNLKVEDKTTLNYDGVVEFDDFMMVAFAAQEMQVDRFSSKFFLNILRIFEYFIQGL